MKKLIIPLLLFMLLWGCSTPEKESAQTNDEVVSRCLELARGYSDADLADTQAVLDYLGECGKCAVDSENALQMTRPEYVKSAFASDGALSSDLEVYSVFPDGGFTRFDLRGGKVLQTHLYFSGTLPVVGWQTEYALTGAQLTEKGVLLFTYVIPDNPESKYAHDGYIVPCTMLKTAAPDPELEALCEKYVSPLGFAHCNLLSSDWSQEDCSAIDIGGAYDRLFFLRTGENLWSDSSGVAVDEFTGEVHIPAENLISLLTCYLPLSRGELEGREEYDAQAGEFVFCIAAGQSFLDRPQPECEVIKRTENPNGSLTLTVDEVFTDEGSVCLCRCELTLMPNADGSLKYVSNRVLLSEK